MASSPTVKRSDNPPLAIAAATRPAKARSEPIERSMPAVRMTKVMPIARRPVIDTCRATLSRFTVDRKRGSSTAKTIIRTMRKISGAKRAAKPNGSKPALAFSVVTCASLTRSPSASRRLPDVERHHGHQLFLVGRIAHDLAGDDALAHGDD